MVDLFKFGIVNRHLPKVWPNDVRNFIVSVNDNDYVKSGTGIFYRRNAFITNAECFGPNTNPIVVQVENATEHSSQRRMCNITPQYTINGISMSFVSTRISTRTNYNANRSHNNQFKLK